MINQRLNSFIIKKYRKNIPSELERFITSTLVSEAPDESIISHIFDLPDKPVIAIQVWRLKQGQLIEEDRQILQNALGNNRSDWPPRAVLFTVKSLKGNKATVTVLEHYSSGITEYSRGGQEQKWEFIKLPEGWKVHTKEIIMIWD